MHLIRVVRNFCSDGSADNSIYTTKKVEPSICVSIFLCEGLDFPAM